MYHEVEEFNARLEQVYQPLHQVWQELRAAHSRLSWPFLLKAREEYLAAPSRVMLMGQETLGWHDGHPGEPSPVVPISEMMNLQGGCCRGRDFKAGGSPFWAFARDVAFATSGQADEGLLVWNNLLKVDDAAHRPSISILDRLAAVTDPAGLTVHQLELAILRPQLLLFVTGPNYDMDIRRAFPGAEFDPIDPFPLRQLAKVRIPGFTGVAFRTYHPKYLRLRAQAIRKGVLELLHHR